MGMRYCLGVIVLLAALTGCAQSYTVPGGPADLRTLGVSEQTKLALSDAKVREVLSKKPLVSFPAAIAVARVQSADYRNYSLCQGRALPYGGPRMGFSVVTVRDIEKDEDIEGIARLPQVSGVVTMKRAVIQEDLKSDMELRLAAARLHADLLLFYTFDTEFYTDTAVRPLGVITLGLFPNKTAKVTCTASAVLMDVNNGYIYAVIEATGKDQQLANAWSSEEAMDQVRRRVEREAFEDLLGQFKKEWGNVLGTYAGHRKTARE